MLPCTTELHQMIRRQYVCHALFIVLLWTCGHTLQCSAERGIPQGVMNRWERSLEHRTIVIYHVDKTAGGLVNQLLCHIGAFLLAIPLKADILLPSALSRSTFDTKWWRQEWHTEPLQSLLDVKDMIRYWRRRGIVVHQVEQQKSGP